MNIELNWSDKLLFYENKMQKNKEKYKTNISKG